MRIARDADHLELIRRLGVASALWVPLTVGGRTIGVVSLGRAAPQRPFVPEDLVLAEEIASRAALAVDNATAYRRVRERERQQAEVARLGQAALSGIELQELFDAACEAIRATLDVEYAKVLELLPDGRHVRLVAGVGWRRDLAGTAILPVERTQAGYALLIGGPIVVDDLRTERRFDGSALLDEHGVVSGLSVAIAGAGGAWGVLGAHTTRRRRFTEDDVHFVQAVANVLAQAIERRRVEKAVLERDRRLELTLTASRTATWELDLRSGELTWSDRETEHGSAAPKSRRLPLDEYLDRIVHPADREPLRLAIERVVEEGTPLDVEFRILTGRTVRWMNGIARVFYDGSGAPARLLGIARDISDRKRAEEERDRLLEAERTAHRLREAFVGVLSHELRTPITTIYGGVKVLARGGAGADERTSILQDVEAEADRLRRLVEDLLVIARAERGGLEVGADPVRIGNVVERVAAAEGARWPSVGFRLRIEPGTPLARGDETYLEQVLRNLLGNAAKYGPPDGTVEVAVEAGPREVRVRVLDEGPGVAPEDLERVFDLFYRSPEAVRAASGAGIGLFVCRSLVEAMGGRVWAGRRPGGGAEFGFALQAYDDPGL
jgi:signal transduction histidine kinase